MERTGLRRQKSLVIGMPQNIKRKHKRPPANAYHAEGVGPEDRGENRERMTKEKKDGIAKG